MTQTAELLDRAPPCDHAAERALLRGIVLDQALPDEQRLTTRHFQDEGHRAIFVAIATVRENALPIDLAHVVEELRRTDQLDGIGGIPALAEILSAEIIPASVPDYLRRVRDCYSRRCALNSAIEIIRGVHSDAPTDAILWDWQERIETIQEDSESARPPKPQAAGLLIAENPRLHEPVIDGLLRRGETGNIIAPPKMGKSWLAYGLALNVVTGGDWFGRFPCRPGHALIIDNELHKSTLAGRLQTVGQAMRLRIDDYRDSLSVLSLRGQLLNLHGIASLLKKIEPGTYDLIILDAFYRSLPVGASENDNATIAGLYNVVDSLTKRLDCCWVNIHHSTKGSQAEKAITDVGAGAGSQSRAADAHLILRPHEEDGAIVLEAVVRSFAPVDPLALRWDFPLWMPDSGLDPTQLRGRRTKAEERQLDRDGETKAKILKVLGEGPKMRRAIEGRVGIGRDRGNRLLGLLESEGAIGSEETTCRGGIGRRYYLQNGDQS